MPRFRRLPQLVIALLAACSGDPSGPPPTGSLTVAVSGLPAGVSPDVTVTGPAGYAHDVGGTETLSGLAPGSYTVSASAVGAGTSAYAPDQALQSVDVAAGGGAASAQVVYSMVGGALAVSVSGLPAGTAAAVHVAGPAGYDQSLSATTTLEGLAPGSYSITAQSVSAAGTSYDPTPAAQTANVSASATVGATVSYAVAGPAALNLRIDGMYLTQSVQTYAGAVPLVQNRDGFLRVFVTANQGNLAQPAVRVRFFSAGVLVSETTIPAPGPTVPLSPSEGALASSWNLPVPKTLIQPNLSILAEVDPANAIAESNESDNSFPATGVAQPMDVRAASTFSVRFVPILQSVNGRQGDVTNANKAGYLVEALKLHPLSAVDADLRAPYTTDVPAVTAGNDNGEWTTVLSELDALRVADGTTRYYYGVVSPTYSSGVAGIGYIGGKAALGWDRSGADEVAAHEWGHNWGRLHSPCGGAPNPDPNYPYAGGSTGVYGLDVAAQAVMPPTSTDVMAYCANTWISDYTYQGVLAYRSAHPDVVAASAPAVQPSLLVWGRVVDGRPVLEPAFAVVTRPVLPARGGPYSLEGRAADGTELFHLSFSPLQVADDPRDGEHFAFAVPLPADRAPALATLRLVVPGRPAVSVRATGAVPSPTDVRIQRAAAGRVALTWDPVRHPMLMVRDPVTGEVLSFARGGRSEVVTERPDLDVQLSNGIGSSGVRVPVPGR